MKELLKALSSYFINEKMDHADLDLTWDKEEERFNRNQLRSKGTLVKDVEEYIDFLIEIDAFKKPHTKENLPNVKFTL